MFKTGVGMPVGVREPFELGPRKFSKRGDLQNYPMLNSEYKLCKFVTALFILSLQRRDTIELQCYNVIAGGCNIYCL